MGSASRRLRAGAVTTAAVNFVDLAGSERAAHSADTGEQEKLRQKEVRGGTRQASASCLAACSARTRLTHTPCPPQASSIHKSLLTLSCVIRGLADNQVRQGTACVFIGAEHVLWAPTLTRSLPCRAVLCV